MSWLYMPKRHGNGFSNILRLVASPPRLCSRASTKSGVTGMSFIGGTTYILSGIGKDNLVGSLALCRGSYGWFGSCPWPMGWGWSLVQWARWVVLGGVFLLVAFTWRCLTPEGFRLPLVRAHVLFFSYSSDIGLLPFVQKKKKKKKKTQQINISLLPILCMAWNRNHQFCTTNLGVDIWFEVKKTQIVIFVSHWNDLKSKQHPRTSILFYFFCKCLFMVSRLRGQQANIKNEWRTKKTHQLGGEGQGPLRIALIISTS
jgi:hypothetical protein